MISSRNKRFLCLFIATCTAPTMIQSAFIPQSLDVLHPQGSPLPLSSKNKNSPQVLGRPPFINTSKIRTDSIHNRKSNTLLFEAREKNFLMDEFTTADGEIVNPYKELKVGRNASRAEIRSSYRTLSKKYHPDATRFSKVLPGNCNNLDDARDAWERIKLSYEILSDKKMRMKYNRQSALNDPGQALGRAALHVMGWGVTGLAKGIIEIGVAAAEAATNTIQDKNPTQTPTPSSVEEQKGLKKQGIDDEARLENVMEQREQQQQQQQQQLETMEKVENDTQSIEKQQIVTEYKDGNARLELVMEQPQFKPKEKVERKIQYNHNQQIIPEYTHGDGRLENNLEQQQQLKPEEKVERITQYTENQQIIPEYKHEEDTHLENVMEQQQLRPEEEVESKAHHFMNQQIVTEYKHELLAELEAEAHVTEARKRQLEEDVEYLQEAKIIEDMLREEARLAEEAERNRIVEEKRLKKARREQQIAAEILRSVSAQQIRLKRGKP